MCIAFKGTGPHTVFQCPNRRTPVLHFPLTPLPPPCARERGGGGRNLLLSRFKKDRDFKLKSVFLFVEMHISVCLGTNQKQCFGKLLFTTCDGKRRDYCVQNIRYVK